MKRVTVAALVLLTVLSVPFLARSRRNSRSVPVPPSGASGAVLETLVVLTPHNEAIRSEIEYGFRTYMAARGRRIEVDWRSPGGTAEIGRYLSSQYAAAFEQYWTRQLGRRWSPEIAAGFARPAASGPAASGSGDEVDEARRAFLASQVSTGIDLLFGGGSSEFVRQASAGRLVDSGIQRRRPDWFGPAGIPEEVGGERYWDREGRWVGVCLSSFGICFNRDALARLEVAEPPSSWRALADPRYHAELALADPTKSGSVATAFEMIIQSEINEARHRLGMDAGPGAKVAADALDAEAARDGWAAAMRMIRRLGGNARYFTDVGMRVALDVAAGDAAVGMCIDFYGRSQADVTAAAGGRPRMGFLTARGETAINADPIATLRGAPHPGLALDFIEFILSEEGQKLWSFRRGAPGGPQRYTLHRLPIQPHLYDPIYDPYRADPGENPYLDVGDFVYRKALTGGLSGVIAFVVRVMCIDPADELSVAYAALAAARFPPRATALFDDVSAIDYAAVTGPLRTALRSADPLDAQRESVRLVSQFRAQYRQVAALAREGQ
jgi:iron(III) transport system substrate-binding protein